MAARARQQEHAELLLEQADLPAEDGLGDEAALRRAAEVKLLGNGDEVPELAEIELRRSGDDGRLRHAVDRTGHQPADRCETRIDRARERSWTSTTGPRTLHLVAWIHPAKQHPVDPQSQPFG
jgi:hypothetical protein